MFPTTTEGVMACRTISKTPSRRMRRDLAAPVGTAARWSSTTSPTRSRPTGISIPNERQGMAPACGSWANYNHLEDYLVLEATPITGERVRSPQGGRGHQDTRNRFVVPESSFLLRGEPPLPLLKKKDGSRAVLFLFSRHDCPTRGSQSESAETGSPRKAGSPFGQDGH